MGATLASRKEFSLCLVKDRPTNQLVKRTSGEGRLRAGNSHVVPILSLRIAPPIAIGSILAGR